MKKKILFIGLLFIAIAATAFTVMSDHSTGRAHRVEGVYIFTDSEPIADFYSLGVVKYSGTFSMSNQYTDVRDALIKRAKKDYPNADALIFTFIAGSSDKCEAVKFKD